MPELGSEVIINDAILFALQTKKDVSVNLSVCDITNENTVAKVYRHIKRSGVGKQILFELLEDEYIKDYRPIVRFIFKMRGIGVRFGIDDVGKNYSNFDRLINLPLDFIKIDGSVIRFVNRNEDARGVVKDMISIAHKNDIRVIAEYCSCEKITQMAISLGVDYLQGFYLGKPKSFTSIIESLDCAESQEDVWVT